MVAPGLRRPTGPYPRQGPTRSPARDDRPRLPLASTLILALVGLTLMLAAIAAISVGSLYSARQDYEDALARAYEVESASSRLLASAVIEEAAFRAEGADATQRRARALEVFDEQAEEALGLAAGDPESVRLLRGRIAAQERARQLAGAAASDQGRLARAIMRGREAGDKVRARQRERRETAREDAAGKTRSALITAGGAGALALTGALGLVFALIGSIRRPLDELVTATKRLAAGNLAERVEPSGPLELRELDTAFNAMAEQLETAQTHIEAERQKLAVTIESLGDGLVVCDSNGVITAVNPRGREIAPILKVGSDAHLAGSPLPPPAEALDAEVTLESNERTLSITAARLGPAASRGVVWTLRDVSERARLERIKSDFVAIASHELRSPLTAMKGFVELLAASEALGGREREFVEVILLSTDRLVELVNDLLDVAQLEAGRMEMHPRLFDLADGVREVTALLSPSLTAKSQRLELDLPEGLPRALADPGRVRQIVTNLLSNAHQYTGEGGRIEIAARAREGRLRLTVSDDGGGMSDEDVSRVFDRFVRRDEGSSAGTGLGLSIVRSLVDLQGGSIEVDSVRGEGSTFTVYLPAGPAPAAGPDEAVRGQGVLVVGRSALRARLEPGLVRLGLDHEWVTSATAASQACRHREFAVALVDAGMRSPEVVLAGSPLAPDLLLVTAGDEPPDLRADVRAVPVEQAAAAAREILTGGA
ncbi:MAG: ATP-binding protein [Thermoleophilaceae bacterium]